MTPRMRTLIQELLCERKVDPDLRKRAVKATHVINYGMPPTVGQAIIRELLACPTKGS